MKRIEDVLPVQLGHEYLHNTTVNAHFNRAADNDGTREDALVAIVKSLVAQNDALMHAAMKVAAQPLPVLRFDGPQPEWFSSLPPQPLTVHLLDGGRALCGKPGLPGTWDSGHRWVSAHGDDLGPRSAANCPECLAAVSEREP